MLLQFLLVLPSLFSQGTHTSSVLSHLQRISWFVPLPRHTASWDALSSPWLLQHIPPPHLTPSTQPLSSSLAQVHSRSWAPLASHQQHFVGQGRGGTTRRPQHQPQAAPLLAPQGNTWNYSVSHGLPRWCQQEKWVPALHPLHSRTRSLPSCLFLNMLKDFAIFRSKPKTLNSILSGTTSFFFFIKQKEEVDIIPLKSYKSLNSNFFLLL